MLTVALRVYYEQNQSSRFKEDREDVNDNALMHETCGSEECSKIVKF